MRPGKNSVARSTNNSNQSGEPDPRPFVIGITGNIACGKSLVVDALAELGAETIDADRVAHEIMSPGQDAFHRIVDHFGQDVVAADGTLDRRAIGSIVFADPDELRTLEEITHPATVNEILRRVQVTTRPVAVIDAIKLFEAGLADACDEVWCVTCTGEQQVERLMARNGLDNDEALTRINAQPPQSEKIERSDVVIDNSGSKQQTREQVIARWRALKTESSQP